MCDGINMKIGPQTRYIVSTSGRISSMQRYRKLLQDILQLDIAYIPIHSNSSIINYDEEEDNILQVKIEPQQ
jgi:hypothetical protein